MRNLATCIALLALCSLLGCGQGVASGVRDSGAQICQPNMATDAGPEVPPDGQLFLDGGNACGMWDCLELFDKLSEPDTCYGIPHAFDKFPTHAGKVVRLHAPAPAPPSGREKALPDGGYQWTWSESGITSPIMSSQALPGDMGPGPVPPFGSTTCQHDEMSIIIDYGDGWTLERNILFTPTGVIAAANYSGPNCSDDFDTTIISCSPEFYADVCQDGP